MRVAMPEVNVLHRISHHLANLILALHFPFILTFEILSKRAQYDSIHFHLALKSSEGQETELGLNGDCEKRSF